ncbi:MAG: hypothetical protein EOP93_22325 [Lysobacteraceae bacterium]|nr:MAG: hypothetical protein EOP93_22325 [Xanthomonadaceae bacterium]
MGTHATPMGFRVGAVVALLWNLLGLVMFWKEMTLTPATVAALPAAQQPIHAAMPSWVYGFFAIAVFAGLAGAVGLLLARRWAVPLMLLSFLGVTLQMASAYATTPVWALTGAAGVLPPLVLVVACLLLWLFARYARGRGWLR